MSSPLPPSAAARPRRSTATIVVAVALVLAVGLSGAGLAAWAAMSFLRDGDGGGTSAPPPEPSASVEAPEYPAELARFYEQDLEWRRCGSNQCVRLLVPLDYAEPEGQTIELAVLRSPAARRGERVGQLLVNPGGPGGSGVNYAASGAFTFGQEVTRYFDIVGLDPRGVGQSTPLECAGTAGTDAFLEADPDPDTPAEVDEYDRINREFGESCLTNSGDLVRHMSTEEAARDIDILRAALGEPQLDYLGASYGTLLGATYADLFPGNVRRMVLDGALDPTLTNEGVNLGQTRGFQTALEAYLRSCIDQGDCVLGDTVPEAGQRIRDLLDEIDADPLPTSSGRELTEGLARYGIILPLYLEDYWPLLTAALTSAIEKGSGDQLLALADQYASRGPDGYRDNSVAAFNAVSCLDYADSVPVEEIPSRLEAFEEASPTFGRAFVYDLSRCDSWPIKSTRTPGPLEAEGAPPIVVIGTTRDPATPYVWSQALASQLESGRLLTRDGDGHTGFQQGNDCIDDAVEEYLVGGVAPRDGLSC